MGSEQSVRLAVRGEGEENQGDLPGSFSHPPLFMVGGGRIEII